MAKVRAGLLIPPLTSICAEAVNPFQIGQAKALVDGNTQSAVQSQVQYLMRASHERRKSCNICATQCCLFRIESDLTFSDSKEGTSIGNRVAGQVVWYPSVLLAST